MRDTNFLPHVSPWELMVMLRRCQHLLEVFMDESLDGMGMSFAQYRALEAISEIGPMHIAYLGRLLKVSRQAAQRTARQLANHGLVDLRAEGRDVVIEITPEARRRLKLCRAATSQLRGSLADHLSEEERSSLASLLRAAERAFQPPPPRVRPWWLD